MVGEAEIFVESEEGCFGYSESFATFAPLGSGEAIGREAFEDIGGGMFLWATARFFEFCGIELIFQEEKRVLAADDEGILRGEIAESHFD